MHGRSDLASMLGVFRRMIAVFVVAGAWIPFVCCGDGRGHIVVHVKALNTTLSCHKSSYQLQFLLLPVSSTCKVQYSHNSVHSVNLSTLMSLKQILYIEPLLNEDQWSLQLNVDCCQKSTSEGDGTESFQMNLTRSTDQVIYSTTRLSWLVGVISRTNGSSNQSLVPCLKPPKLCSSVPKSANNTSASNDTMKLVLGLTIAGGAVGLFALLFITSVYRSRRRCPQRHDVNGIAGDSSLNIIKGNNTETLGRQLQVHTFGRSLTPEPPNSPSQRSFAEDPDLHIVLPPLMYSDVLRASTILDNISTRPSSMMSAVTYTHRSKSFESTLSADNIDGTPPPLMHANMLAISIHDLDMQENAMPDAEEGTSV